MCSGRTFYNNRMLWPPSYHESCLIFYSLALKNSECLRATHEIQVFSILFHMASIFIPLPDMNVNGVRLLENRAPFSSCWHLLLGRGVVPLQALGDTFGLQGREFSCSHLCYLLCSCTFVAINSLSWTLSQNPKILHVHDHQHSHTPTTLLSPLGEGLVSD